MCVCVFTSRIYRYNNNHDQYKNPVQRKPPRATRKGRRPRPNRRQHVRVQHLPGPSQRPGRDFVRPSLLLVLPAPVARNQTRLSRVQKPNRRGKRRTALRTGLRRRRRRPETRSPQDRATTQPIHTSFRERVARDARTGPLFVRVLHRVHADAELEPVATGEGGGRKERRQFVGATVERRGFSQPVPVARPCVPGLLVGVFRVNFTRFKGAQNCVKLVEIDAVTLQHFRRS